MRSQPNYIVLKFFIVVAVVDIIVVDVDFVVVVNIVVVSLPDHIIFSCPS